MIGHGQRRLRSIGVHAQHRDVVAFSYQSKTEELKGPLDAAYRGVNRELAHLNGDSGIGQEDIEQRFFGLERAGAERLQMKLDG